jgi:hypothetical protein
MGRRGSRLHADRATLRSARYRLGTRAALGDSRGFARAREGSRCATGFGSGARRRRSRHSASRSGCAHDCDSVPSRESGSWSSPVPGQERFRSQLSIAERTLIETFGEKALTETLSERTMNESPSGRVLSETLGARMLTATFGARSMNESFDELRVIDATTLSRGGPRSARVDASSNALETEARFRAPLARAPRSRR